MADAEYSHVSSSLIKQVVQYGGAESLKQFVPEELVARSWRRSRQPTVPRPV